jgi:hypothetical protein
MGKNKIGEALLKINSGQPGSPIGPEQPKKPIQVPSIKEFWNVSNNSEKKYTPGADIYAPENQDMRGGDIRSMVNNFFKGGFRAGSINNSIPALAPYFTQQIDPSKDPDWYKKGEVGTANDFGNFLEEMENAGADDQNALFWSRKIMADPKMRKKIFSDKSPIHNIGSLRYFLTPEGSQGQISKVDPDEVENYPITNTKLEGLANELAKMYMGLHQNRAKDYNIQKATKISSQQGQPVQGGMQGLQQNLENVVNPKLRVTKTP